jgi:hypothetical protein
MTIFRQRFRSVGILLVAFAAGLVLGVPGDVSAAPGYQELAAQIDRHDLSEKIDAFASLGSRVAGYPGNEKAADMILQAFEDLGLETLVQEFDLPTPLETGSALTIAGHSYDLHAVWPNLCRTSQVPSAGIAGPVIYVGQGNLSDFNGKDVKDAIVLMDFNTGQNWLHVPLLGAAAVVFIEPARITRGEAEMKMIRCPVDVPRFYVNADDATAIQSMAIQGDVTGRLTSRVAWANKTNRNIIGILPGSDPTLKSEAIILEAYYDSASVAPAVSPGAENAVSIATLLRFAEIFAAHPPKRSVIFLACSGHFSALAGAREFVNLWGKEPRKEKLRHERLDKLNKELAELRKLLDDMSEEIAKMLVRREELTTTAAGMSSAYLARAHQLASRVNVGQLELGESATTARVARLERDVTRKQNDIRIWERLDRFERIHLFIGLDLSTHTATLGSFQVGWYFSQAHLLRFYSPLGKQYSQYAEDICKALGMSVAENFVDGINPIKGREWHTFFPGKIAFDHEMIIRGGRPGIVFTTVNDARSLVDTPLDTLDGIEIDNLVTQDRLLLCMLHDFLNDPTLRERALKRVEALKKMDDMEDVRGTVLEFRRRESFVPNSPVPNSLVLIQGQFRMMMGVNTTVLAMSNETSEFVIRGEMASRAAELEAYAFDPDNGKIAYAPDRGTDGDRKYPRAVYGRSGLKRPVVVFGCVSTDLFDLVDERYFQTLQKIFVYDAHDYSEPISFGYSLNETTNAAEFPSYVEPCAVIYSPPDLDMQVTMSMGLVGIRMIAINATQETKTGVGFPALHTPAITLTPMQIAHDMWMIDDFRIAKLEKHGIVNQLVEELHLMAQESLAIAQTALKERRYDLAVSSARDAWGFESRAYPDVRKTAEDVVKGVLFYLALLLPFAFFAERLFIHSRTIIVQIISTTLIFIVFFLVLAVVHPAFALTSSPPIILLAFIVMALAVMVISIVTMKFNQELKSMKQSKGGVHEADVGRLSVAGAALGLGIANMRRRKTRTGLTAFTLILLTFTVLSFTSVKSYLRSNEIRLAHRPAYDGLMLRDRSWLSLEAPTAHIIANGLKAEAVVSPRAWYTSTDIEKELVIDIARADDAAKTYSVNAILGLTPQEREVMHVEDVVVAGRWMEEGEKDVALLPTTVAKTLGITEDQLGSGSVKVFGTDFRVIGLLDENKLRSMDDLDGEPMTPVNYAMLRPEVIEELKRQAERRSQMGSSGAQSLLQEYKHYGPEKMAVLPYDTVLELGGTLRSIGVRYHDPDKVAESVATLMKRFALSLYAGIDGDSYLFSSVAMTSTSGMETLVIPILIAALIVLNTMLGSVYERTKEIGIYSSLGLAPTHIGLLFLAEAAVFANFGAIVGYLLGQVLAKIIHATGASAGIELNYSSMSAVGVTMIVVIVVLLSTIYPSRKASEIASPGIARKWELPEPDGDKMIVVLPFTVTGRDAFGVADFLQEYFAEYVGYAGGEFLAEDVHMAMMGDSLAEGVSIRMRMWLAPYDLGVSQDFRLDCVPTEDEDIFAVEIHLTRLAGDISSWKKTNSLFLSSIRKQFLIWRTVPQGEKVAYAERAEEILKIALATT